MLSKARWQSAHTLVPATGVYNAAHDLHIAGTTGTANCEHRLLDDPKKNNKPVLASEAFRDAPFFFPFLADLVGLPCE